MLRVFIALFFGCWAPYATAQSVSMEKLIDAQFRFAARQYKFLMKNTAADSVPRTWYALEQQFRNDVITSWISGFYPGSLWYIYEYTGDKAFLEEAQRKLKLLEPLRHFKDHHDLGFMVFCSFGNGYRLTGDTAYKSVIIDAANALATRFRPQIGSIQSWNQSSRFKCPVIIDNMMNLELLLWAAEKCGNAFLREIAITHANTTIKNHFHPDYSSWHVLDYDCNTGTLERKVTFQGLADHSAWNRGQGWGLYGFTMMYRFTKDEKYLHQAKQIAAFILNHPNLPSDKVPYWDFHVKGDLSVLRDASAAAVMASALLELATYCNGEEKQRYIHNAEIMIRSLASPKYRAALGSNGGFLLKHSVGALPLHQEIDVPLTYADYYWLEAMLRYKKWVLGK